MVRTATLRFVQQQHTTDISTFVFSSTQNQILSLKIKN